VVTSTTAVTASRVSPVTAGTFTSASIADVYKTLAALPPRHRSKASHIANYATLNIIRQMSASAAGSSFWANLGANVPEELLGRPVYEASAMASSMTTGSNILLTGNFGEGFVIFDRIGISLEYIPNVVGANQRPTGQRGWFATWRVGSDTVDPNAFRVLKL
jgi:HK97 family phage major capsid protein